jgi:hypothetical protein
MLKKSFLGDGELGSPMHFMCVDEGDHIVSHKSFLSALRSFAAVETSKNQLSRNFGGVQFSTLQHNLPAAEVGAL